MRLDVPGLGLGDIDGLGVAIWQLGGGGQLAADTGLGLVPDWNNCSDVGRGDELALLALAVT